MTNTTNEIKTRETGAYASLEMEKAYTTYKVIIEGISDLVRDELLMRTTIYTYNISLYKIYEDKLCKYRLGEITREQFVDFANSNYERALRKISEEQYRDICSFASIEF